MRHYDRRMDRLGAVYGPVAAITLGWFRAMGWRVDVVGGEHLPRSGPAILAMNHVSHLDPLIAGVAAFRRGRRVSYFAKRELFERPVVARLLRAAGAIEVDRGGRATASLEAAAEAIRRGELVGIFPEGTISTAFVPTAPRAGAARLAIATGVPISPGALWGGQRIVTKDHKDLRRRGVRFTVRIGAPVLARPGEDAQHLTQRVWEEVRRLVEASAREYPQQPAGPDDRWWLPAHLGGTAPTAGAARARARHEAEERRARRALAAREAGQRRTAYRSAAAASAPARAPEVARSTSPRGSSTKPAWRNSRTRG